MGFTCMRSCPLHHEKGKLSLHCAAVCVELILLLGFLHSLLDDFVTSKLLTRLLSRISLTFLVWLIFLVYSPSRVLKQISVPVGLFLSHLLSYFLTEPLLSQRRNMRRNNSRHSSWGTNFVKKRPSNCRSSWRGWASCSDLTDSTLKKLQSN